MLRKVSLGSIGLTVGGLLTLMGFYAYFIVDRPTLNLIGFFYGVPVLLGGLALKAAELKPTPYRTEPTEEVLQLREQQATDTQNQIRKDVTRYRYGQEAHLDTSLEALGLSPTDEERPDLTLIREEIRHGFYTLVLEFSSPLIEFEQWQKKQDKIERFFGPGVRAVVSQPEEDWIELALIAAPDATDSSASATEA